VALLLGIGPLASWRHAPLGPMLRRIALPAIASGVFACGVAAGSGSNSPAAWIGFAAAAWIATTTLADAIARHHAPTRALAGMWLAHLGVAAFAFGVASVGAGERGLDAALRPGESFALGSWRVALQQVGKVRGANYDGHRANVLFTSADGRQVALQPERRVYRALGTPTTEAAIDPGITRDLVVSIGEPVDGAWLLRAHVKPFVDWIWAGCALMALGGLVAASRRPAGASR